MRFETITVVAPTVEPITLDDAKSQLRLTALQTHDDAYISALIPVARDRAENFCNRYFTEQTIKIVIYDSWTSSEITLPYPDLVSIDAVSYVDSDGIDTVIDSADYSFDPDTRTIYFSVDLPTANAIKVTANTSAPVEFEGAKQGILMMLTDMYELRTEAVIGAAVNDNPAVNAMLFQYRVNMGV